MSKEVKQTQVYQSCVLAHCNDSCTINDNMELVEKCDYDLLKKSHEKLLRLIKPLKGKNKCKCTSCLDLKNETCEAIREAEELL